MSDTLSGETLSGETFDGRNFRHQAKNSSLSPDEKFRPKGFFIILIIIGLWSTTQTIQEVKTPEYILYWPK